MGCFMYTLMVIALLNVSSCLQHYNRRLKYIRDKEVAMRSAIDPLTCTYNRTKTTEERE